VNAQFIDPMLLLRTGALPEGSQWAYELKLDGYRAIAFKTKGHVHLRSRNDHDFAGRYPAVVRGLAKLPDETVVDGELVAFDQEGRRLFSDAEHGLIASARLGLRLRRDGARWHGRDERAAPRTIEAAEEEGVAHAQRAGQVRGRARCAAGRLIASVRAQGFEPMTCESWTD
jgi:hypothetical protein